MANEEHLEILRRSILMEGVDRWNRWRKENPDVKPDFSQADLSEANFNEIDLSGANLSGANLSETALNDASLVGTNLAEANLSGAGLESANLVGVTLKRANLLRAVLLGACISKANLSEANFSEAILPGADLFEADLTLTNFNKAKLDGTILQGAKLVNATLNQADLSNADLRRADFSGADLSNADLDSVQAIETNFTGAKFTGACLKDGNFSRANLDRVSCEYIFLKASQQERLPAGRDFYPGEFSKLFRADRSYSKLAVLDQLIDRFENLLDELSEGNESIFHDFLKENPILIDVYVSQADIVSKPRFHYPNGESPLGKTYVEPDFVIKYAGNKYKLIELERPGKYIATKQGQPTSGVNQAAFQIAEWDDYIRNHIDRIRDEYPGIANNRSYLIVLGRSNEKSIGAGRNSGRYMSLIASQYPCEVCSYDDLLSKAKQAHAALTALSL